ncbi:TIGR00282 family metallophosphoesterase [Spirochaeta dissipatitropha]
MHAVKTLLPGLKKELEPDLVVANADGATNGYGLGKNHSLYLRKLGVDVITLGDQAYFKKDMVGHIGGARFILRPANLPPDSPGRGWIITTANEQKVAIISFLGQSGYSRMHANNPFTYLPVLVDKIKSETTMICLEFHAMTTAEKNSMFWHADGMVSAVIGSGTRVQSADERVLQRGAAVITDIGRTGSHGSVAGFKPEPEIKQFLQGIPLKSEDAWEDVKLQGVLLTLAPDGRAESIKRISIDVPERAATAGGTGVGSGAGGEAKGGS